MSTRLNAHDAVRLMKVEARLSCYHDAGKLATMVEVAYEPLVKNNLDLL